jgi:hypothetical protein
MGRYLNYRLIEMLCLLTHILASNAIAVIDKYNKHESDKFILLMARWVKHQSDDGRYCRVVQLRLVRGFTLR